MRLSALSRSLLIVIALLTGLGQSFGALAHGVAHAHEAVHDYGAANASKTAHDEIAGHGHDHTAPPDHADEHEAQRTVPLRPEFSATEHQHEHQHAILDAGLKSRTELAPFVVAHTASPPLLMTAAIAPAKPTAASTAPPPKRDRTAGSPRGPPAR